MEKAMTGPNEQRVIDSAPYDDDLPLFDGALEQAQALDRATALRDDLAPTGMLNAEAVRAALTRALEGK